MKKRNTLKTIAFLVVITIVVFLGWNFWGNDIQNLIKNQISVSNNKILGNSQDLVYFSIKPEQSVSGIITATGSVKGGYFFEGNILVNILNADKEPLRNGYGKAVTNWMTSEPVEFETELNFMYLPKGEAYIEIQNDNPAGPNEGMKKNILIPIIIN